MVEWLFLHSFTVRETITKDVYANASRRRSLSENIHTQHPLIKHFHVTIEEDFRILPSGKYKERNNTISTMLTKWIT